jgi:hypothetical protein
MGSMGVAKPNQKDLGFMKELLEAGKVKPVIDRRYPFGETAEALRLPIWLFAKGFNLTALDRMRVAREQLSPQCPRIAQRAAKK